MELELTSDVVTKRKSFTITNNETSQKGPLENVTQQYGRSSFLSRSPRSLGRSQTLLRSASPRPCDICSKVSTIDMPQVKRGFAIYKCDECKKNEIKN